MTSNGAGPLRDEKMEAVQEIAGSSASSVAKKESFSSLASYIVIAVGIALFIRFLVAAPYVVAGASMEPTFYDWNYLIIDKLVYDIVPPQRGDVIVFTLPQDSSRSLIKRVIGLPGEKIRIAGATVTIINVEHPKGFVLSEPYVAPENASKGDRIEVTLGPDQYFVLGDNRHVSADSRIWGTLPKKDISGRVDVRLYPIDMIGMLPGAARYQ